MAQGTEEALIRGFMEHNGLFMDPKFRGDGTSAKLERQLAVVAYRSVLADDAAARKRFNAYKRQKKAKAPLKEKETQNAPSESEAEPLPPSRAPSPMWPPPAPATPYSSQGHFSMPQNSQNSQFTMHRDSPFGMPQESQFRQQFMPSPMPHQMPITPYSAPPMAPPPRPYQSPYHAGNSHYPTPQSVQHQSQQQGSMSQSSQSSQIDPFLRFN